MSGKLVGQVYTLDLPRTERDVLIAVCNHANDDGANAYPSADLLAWELDMSERHIRRQLGSLEAKNILKVVAYGKGGRGKATEYEVHLENGKPKPERAKKAPKMSAFSTINPDTQMSAFNKEGDMQNPDILDQNPDILEEKADIFDTKGGHLDVRPTVIRTVILEPSIKNEVNNGRARENPLVEKSTGLRGMLAGQSGEQERVHTALYEAACGVLNSNSLTKDQRKETQRLFDRYGTDDRFDTELVEYARAICASKNKKDLRYFAAIISNRIDDPEWPGMARENELVAKQKEADSEQSNPNVARGRQSADRNARGNRSLDWNAGLSAYIHTTGDNLQEFPRGQPKSA